jgi:hypothetical protein
MSSMFHALEGSRSAGRDATRLSHGADQGPSRTVGHVVGWGITDGMDAAFGGMSIDESRSSDGDQPA